MKTLLKNLRKSSIRKLRVGKVQKSGLRGGRLELVPRLGKVRPDITVRFQTKEQKAIVKAAASRAKESMSQFMVAAALARAKHRPLPLARAV
jgi:Protein of unknown function (DUF1778)